MFLISTKKLILIFKNWNSLITFKRKLHYYRTMNVSKKIYGHYVISTTKNVYWQWNIYLVVGLSLRFDKISRISVNGHKNDVIIRILWWVKANNWHRLKVNTSFCSSVSLFWCYELTENINSLMSFAYIKWHYQFLKCKYLQRNSFYVTI